MNSDYPERKHESPFADYHPEQQSPFAAESPKVSPPENVPPPNTQPPALSPGTLGQSAVQRVSRNFRADCRRFFGVWAFWTFQQYRHASDYVEYLLQNPNALLHSKYNQDEIIRQNKIFADHDQFEAIWVGAVSLVLLTGAALLFVRAFKIGKRLKAAKLQFQPIDPRSIPPLKNPIQIKYTKYQTRLLIGLSGFFGLLTMINLNHLFRSPFATTEDIIYKGVVFSGLILSIIGTFIFLTIRAKRRAVRLFDSSGITRGDGRRFAWSEFRGVVVKTANNRFSLKYVYRVELVFASGESAWLIPQRVKNYAEVFAFADALPRAVWKN